MRWLSYLKPPPNIWSMAGAIITFAGLIVGGIALVSFLLGALGVIDAPSAENTRWMLGGIAFFIASLVLLFIQAPYEVWKKDMVAKDKIIAALSNQITLKSRLYVFVEHFDIKRVGTNGEERQRVQINLVNCTNRKLKIDRGAAKIASIGSITIDEEKALEGTPYTIPIGELIPVRFNHAAKSVGSC